MTKRLSMQAAEIPLYLIPKVVARLIEIKREAVYRISIVRTHWHHHNVSVRVKRILPEQGPVPVAVPVPDDPEPEMKDGRRWPG